ncbi:hypothetical protein LFX15_18875 [Leptospira levettii]|uniref:hypothetical protein n=1 Tax=Leptospira levettii TaxID=2023178 RepID=UPI001EEA1C23|nr:hypothetical protein [Leptospira levettii]MCG6150367.1 hypothetical protein [Leptospira levettii]
MRDKNINILIFLFVSGLLFSAIYFGLLEYIASNQKITGFSSLSSILGLMASFVLIYLSYNIQYYLDSAVLKRELLKNKEEKTNEIDSLIFSLIQKIKITAEIKKDITDTFTGILIYSRFLNNRSVFFLRITLILTSCNFYFRPFIIYALNCLKIYYNGIPENE